MNRREFIRGCVFLAGGELILRPAMPLGASLWRWVERAQPMMGSYVSIALFTDDEKRAHELITDCFDAMRGVVNEISEWELGSAMTVLNRKRALAASDCPASLQEVIFGACRLSELSGGAFHPFTKRLSALWRNASRRGELPTMEAIEEEVAKVRASRAVVESKRIVFEGPAELETGGFGKGFVVDCGIEFLRRAGVRKARIAASGDIRFLGPGPWTVSIEHPRREGMLQDIVVNGSVAVSTSGDYRSCWWIHGQRYHHLLDLRSGFPARGCQSVTVVAPTGLLADGLASAAFVLGMRDGGDFLAAQPGVHGMMVSEVGAIREV